MYDNTSDTTRGLNEPVSSDRMVALLPSTPLTENDVFRMAEIRSLHPDYPQWQRPGRVYLRPVVHTSQVVGVEPDSEFDEVLRPVMKSPAGC